MRLKYIIFISILICSKGVIGQIITFKDKNFENAILNHKTIIDLNGDGKIETIEAEQVAELDIRQKNISRIDEISSFKNLTKLNCGGNKIDTLILSGLLKLDILICWQNNMKVLKLDNLPKLTALYCQENKLTDLNLSNLILLKDLVATRNLLSVLDITKNEEMTSMMLLENAITYLDISKCEKLERFYIDPGVELKKSKNQKDLEPQPIIKIKN